MHLEPVCNLEIKHSKMNLRIDNRTIKRSIFCCLSGHMEVYYGLASQFHTQNGPTFCGPSTLVMVLNTLEVDPKRVWKGVWRWYHEQMLDCCVSLQVGKN